MATQLPAGTTISALQRSAVRRGLQIRKTHYADADGNCKVVQSPLNCDWLRFNGIRATLDQVDTLPYDHTGDAYLGTTTLRSESNPNPVQLTKPRNTYRKYAVTSGFEVADPEVLHRFFTSLQPTLEVGGEDMKNFRAAASTTTKQKSR